MNKYSPLYIILFFSLLSCNNKEIETSEETQIIGLSHRSIIHDGIRRTFILYVPESYSEGTELPLMLNFHGFSGSAEAQMFSADMRPLAESENFILVYPQGALLSSGFPHWNPDPIGGNNKSDIDDIGFIEVIIDSLDEELNIDLSRVYASGYSNGGYLIYGLACRLSNKIAAVGSVAGTMLSSTLNNCAASAPIGVINIHGTADYDVPYNGTTGLKSATDVVNFWKDLNQSEIEEISENNGFNQYDYNDLNGDTYVRHFKIINGGHTWDDNIRYGGKSSSQIIWEFVSLFNLSGIIE
jgi:polyhydroxybutyrate depolymerase